jgi:protein SCO1/2
MNNKLKTATIVALLTAASVGIVVLSDLTQITHPASSPTVNLLNAELLDQNGTRVRFASDIVGDRIVALNFIYTDCSTTCPVVSAIFSKLQSQLGNKLQQDVRLVSLSINPATDTPDKLKVYAERFHAQSEWRWLTGEKAQVDALLKGLGVYNTDYTSHAPVILVGDPVNGEWTRFNGLTSPETIAARIDELHAARNEKH